MNNLRLYYLLTSVLGLYFNTRIQIDSTVLSDLLSRLGLKVPRQRSPQSFGCLTFDFVVSRPDRKPRFRARGPRMYPETSKTVSMSPVKCTRPSVCSEHSNPKISYLGGGGGHLPNGPPLCGDLCPGTLKGFLQSNQWKGFFV